MSYSESFMKEALAEARKAADKGEVPVGAVLVVENKIIARAHNEVETNTDATLHAELLAVRRASGLSRSWRLENAALYVTLEPCTMCIGALILSRVKDLYFGAWDKRQGAVGSIYDLAAHPQLPHKINVYPEILKEESEELLKSFFAACRNRGG